MKRRDFLQGIVASAGAAAAPMPVLAKAAVQTTTKVIPFHYGWACVYAQMNNGISAGDIERVFKVSGAEANGLMDRMLSRGVIRPPGLDGRSHPTRAWEPWDKKSALPDADADPIQNDAQEPYSNDTGTRARQKFHKMIDAMKAEPHYADAV